MTATSAFFAILVFCSTVLLPSRAAEAQTTEERFHDLFVTAGYATGFGAALGAAAMTFHSKPENHLRYVAIGASLGFIGGSVLGSYIIFSPIFTAEAPTSERNTLASYEIPRRGVVVRPTFDRTDKKLASIEGGITLLSF